MRFLAGILVTGMLGAQPHDNLNAVAWMQTSAEYQAIARQTYRAAEVNLERALRDDAWTAALEQTPDSTGEFDKLPPGVILDLDETVLDNSFFQARQTVSATPYSDPFWQKWVAEKKAGIVPGAREFLLFAQARGVRLYYITNRTCDPKSADDPTVAVLRAHALPLVSDRLLCRTGSGDKSARRTQVTREARVLLLIGDDLNDFISLPLDSAARRSFVSDARDRWGERWFVLPNPTYGSWERSISDKRKALRH